MYRAVALRALRQGADLDDAEAMARQAREACLRLEASADATRVLLDGQDVSTEIRSMRVTQATPYVARVPGVREALIAKQRQIGIELGSFVAEGRDQGSTVFPEADVKFFLDATLEKRAQRRYRELRDDGERVDYEQVLEDLRQRDGNDRSRWAPLLVPGGAVRIDTTAKDVTETVDLLEHEVKQRVPPASLPGDG
jgi:cytidylate kinase